MVDADGSLNNAGGAQGASFPMLASEYTTRIDNAHQLQLIAMNMSATYALNQNIDASTTGTGTDVWGSTGFISIGRPITPFVGTLDGLGHTVSGLTINLSSIVPMGLIGVAGPSAVTEEVGLIGAVVALVGTNYGSVNYAYATGSSLVGINSGTISNSYATGNGGLVNSNLGTISNCYATGNVGGGGGLVGSNSGLISNSYATGNVGGGGGGLVGTNSGSISNSYATGNVSGGSYAGGLVGTNNGSISGSHAVGQVSGSNDVGGLVGMDTARGTISASYATGSVSGGDFDVGGLVGETLGTVSSSYATGSVFGNGNGVGGLAGESMGAINNSYATGSVTGRSLEVGGLVGKNDSSGTVRDSYSTGSVIGYAVGGLVGYNLGSVSGSFWNVTTSGLTTSAAGIGMTTAQMQTETNFTSATSANDNVNPGWNFTSVWYMTNGSYPMLQAFETP
jgi:hypothetical protein